MRYFIVTFDNLFSIRQIRPEQVNVILMKTIFFSIFSPNIELLMMSKHLGISNEQTVLGKPSEILYNQSS